jgi:tRNA U34 2-thiouridine synthase MnmA/TrmU
MNPCIDCRILMLHKVRPYMEAAGASFVITGEVLGQRPMSQHWTAMQTVEKESGLEGLLLRPLSARLLPPTIPEIKGWVDREKLCAIEGRQRKEQFAMAKAYGVESPPTPAGGCLLTDPAYSDRLRDVLDHTGGLTVHLAQVIKYGRYFRLDDRTFAIVGRNQDDNFHLEALQQPDEWRFKPVNCLGPTALGVGALDDAQRRAVSSILARYADRPADGVVQVEARRGKEGEPELFLATAAEPETVGATRV